MSDRMTPRARRLELPPTEVFYEKAIARSAEIKNRVRALSTAEIMEEAGVPNMMAGRQIRINVVGATD